MNENNMQHGMDWTGQDLAGWILTEKFDGCRAYWDGHDLWSRGGKRVDLPADWRSSLPSGVHLDCELYFGTGGVYKCGAALRYGRFLPGMELVVFDAPDVCDIYEGRIDAAAQAIAACPFARVASISVASCTADAINLMQSVQASGGEGVMARHPSIRYAAGRTHQLLKVKQADTNPHDMRRAD